MEGDIRQPRRSEDSHKGLNGKVGIIAGSRDYSGAPALTAKAALRSGCDLVKILTSDKVSGTVSSYSENFIVRDYSSSYFGQEAVDQALRLSEWADTVVIGPGLGEPDARAVRDFIQQADCKLVIDADALEYVTYSGVEEAILTPHSGEFEDYVADFLEKLTRGGNVVLKKGAVETLYTESGEKNIEAGHPTMTVGGTGDVLAGITASVVSQGIGLEEAAELAASVNGKAGEKAAEQLGNGALATDIVEKIPEVMNE